MHRDPESLRHWRTGMQKLAKQPNVVTKISALGTNDHSWTTQSIRPVILDTAGKYGRITNVNVAQFSTRRISAVVATVYESVGGEASVVTCSRGFSQPRTSLGRRLS